MHLKSFFLGIVLGIVISLFTAGGYYYWYYYYKVNGPTFNVKIKDKDFDLEIADTDEKREKGLMDRKFIKDNGGMLFVFDNQGWYPFWMKGTYIPLDIIWVNDQKEVVYIRENAKPCENSGISVNPLNKIGDVLKNIPFVCDTIIPTKFAKYVIELKSGKSSELGLKEGDKIEFNLTAK